MFRNRTYDAVTQTIGATPMIKINRLIPEDHATVFAKCEFFQPLNSVKDRIGVAMIEAVRRVARSIRTPISLSLRAGIRELLLPSFVLPKVISSR